MPTPLDVARTAVRLGRSTVAVCLRYRVTGLASEAAFFALMSLPPLVLGIVGALGLAGDLIGPDAVDHIVRAIIGYSSRFLTQDGVDQVIAPTVDAVFRHGRVDLVSIGFLLSLWSGSRALNVFVDTISIMYGQSGVRGIVRTRALSFSLYTGAVLGGVVLLPLVLIGPEVVRSWLSHAPAPMHRLAALYWPLVVAGTVAGVTSLFHVATPRRTPWRRDLPGGMLTLVLWVVASYAIREWAGRAIGGSSVYGPLSSPIVVMVWLYFLAISVLIGAALNAAVREEWPVDEKASLPARVVVSVRRRVAGEQLVNRPALALVPALRGATTPGEPRGNRDADGIAGEPGRVPARPRPGARPVPAGAPSLGLVPSTGLAPATAPPRSVFGPVAAGLVARR